MNTVYHNGIVDSTILSHPKLRIATDSEWVGDTQDLDSSLLSTQVTIDGGGKRQTVILWQPQALTVHPWETLSRLTQEGGAIPVRGDSEGSFWKSLIQEWLESCDRPESLTLHCFYSPVDLRAIWGEDTFEALVNGENGVFLDQKRRLTLRNQRGFPSVFLDSKGVLHPKMQKGQMRIPFILDDLRGNSPGSLGELASITGVEMSKQIKNPKTGEVMDKARMDTALALAPKEFICYGIKDAESLLDIRDNFSSVMKELTKDTLGIELEDKDVKGTNGSLVARVLEKWILGQHPHLPVASLKLGKLSRNLRGKRLEDALALREHSIRHPVSLLAQKYLKVPHESTVYSEASSVTLGAYRDSRAYSAMVQGGRAVNEVPQAFQVGYGADVDLQSCYGSALRDFIYPLGLPTAIGWTQDQAHRKPTLKQVLRKYRDRLVPGLWQIVVSGNLKFAQDLVFSKVSTIAKINGAVAGGWDAEEATGDRDDDISKLPGHFCLLTNEIQNGVITEDVLEIIEKVATNGEKRDFWGLKVESIVFWDAEDQVDSIDDWVATVLADSGCWGAEADSRSRKWHPLRLEGFIGALVDKRAQIKKSQEPQERVKQNFLKLLINTTYGVLASPFFTVGNAVLANNITSKARVGVWMVSKALGTRQSITDGGLWGFEGIPSLEKPRKMPGLAVLGDREAWQCPKEGRHLRNLSNLDLSAMEEVSPEASNLVAVGGYDRLNTLPARVLGSAFDAWGVTHINNFWGHWGLKLQFAIEHKESNFFQRAVYLGKTDYALRLVFPKTTDKQREWRLASGETIDLGEFAIKVRGQRPDFSRPESVSPRIQLMLNLLYGGDEFPESREWEQTHLVKIGEYRKSDRIHKAGDQLTKKYGSREDFRLLKMTYMRATSYQKLQRLEKTPDLWDAGEQGSTHFLKTGIKWAKK